MKYINFYGDILKCKNQDDVFDYFIEHLKPSILLWSYFVNWEKVFENTRKIEIALNNLNYLIGKKNFDDEFRFLVKQNPEIAKVIPALVVRDGANSTKFKILVDYKKKKLIYDDYDFSKEHINSDDIEKYLNFVKESGLKDLIISQKIKNLVDYMIGVEAGLDSNGRKSRSGNCMEDIVDFFIRDMCERKRFKYLKEANTDKIKEELGYNVPAGKSSRRYDFIVDNGRELIIFETNFYGVGGSKLKSTAGEYRNLFDVLAGKYKFVWITDGFGWKSTSRPLRETFDHNEYILSLDMLEKGILEYFI
ncbi:type II restriction endonuclease [Candidatus Desantisbacteria bacterium]|nr:type II restriction endonuclease [Candidatus Desantisbacteria bacterium]